MPEDSSTPEYPKGFFERLRVAPGRPLLLIAVGLLLFILFVRGGCSGVDIEQGQAIATARAALDAHPEAFVPEDTEVKLLRQGFPPTPMWVVVFTIPDPEGDSEQFLHHAAVWVHAGTGELRQINVGEPDDG